MPGFYVSDLDGTLLDADGYLSAVSRQRLERLLEAGLPFTVASARSWVSIRERLGDLPLSLPIIEFNGAFTTDYASGKKLEVESIDSGDARWIHDRLEEIGVAYFISTYLEGAERVYASRVRNGGLDAYLEERKGAADPRLREAETWMPDSVEQVVCMTAVCKRKKLEALRDTILATVGERVVMHLWEDSYLTDWFWLMIHHGNACKGKAVKKLQKHLNWQDRTLTVFGDEVNDLGMMNLADRRIAVANACQPIQMKANIILGRHDEDAVTEFLLRECGNGAVT